MNIIETLQQQRSAETIRATLSRALAARGFDSFIISGIPDRGQDVRPFVLLSGWPAEWFERYASLGYVQFDPVARHCLATAEPFEWGLAPYDRESDLPARRVVEEAAAFGMTDGLCVPIHMETGLHGGVSFVGDTAGMTRQVRLELHMLALYAHARLRGLREEAARPPRRAITAREAEVLKWAAAGKTACEIATITGLSERTVNQHCLNAQVKLGTRNRTQTVVEAIRHNLIAL